MYQYYYSILWIQTAGTFCASFTRKITSGNSCLLSAQQAPSEKGSAPQREKYLQRGASSFLLSFYSSTLFRRVGGDGDCWGGGQN